jgi:hypothetical protein
LGLVGEWHPGPAHFVTTHRPGVPFGTGQQSSFFRRKKEKEEKKQRKKNIGRKLIIYDW